MTPIAPQEECYPEIYFGGFSRVDGTVAFFTRVQAVLNGARIVVDVGCGRGLRREDTCAFRRRLADLRCPGRKVIGVDVSPAGRENPMIDEFYQVEQDKEWPLEAGSVDVVLTDFVIEHVSNPSVFFGEVYRVLKPGGHFCARTPNKFGYVPIMSRLLPSRRHAQLVTKLQQGRKEEDIFPSFYRCNTVASLRHFFTELGMKFVVIPFESEPNYLTFSPILYRWGVIFHRLLPNSLKSTLLIFAEKRH